MLVEPGQRIGDLLVGEPIGRGGMGQVWRVVDVRTGEGLALKVQRSPTERARLRMVREARTQSRLEHPNLLPALRTFVEGDHVAIVLPLVCGPSLEALLQEGPLSEAESLGVLIAVARGLAHVHRMGLVHRDVKPANILIDLQSSGVVPRICDFGLVKADDPVLATVHGATLGTPGYSAPEQAADAARVDGRADLWSLGVLLGELLTGRRDWRPEDLPPRLRAVGVELLETDPEQRLASAGVLVVRLEAMLPEGEPLGADAPLAERVRRFVASAPSPAAPAQTWAASEAAAPARLTVADFLTRREESALRERPSHFHYGRIGLALLAAIAAVVLSARCTG